MNYEELKENVQTAAALRRRQRLQPAGGPGDKIFPPTYPGEGRNPQPRHVFEIRRVSRDHAVCVLIDSVQSQSNRLEEALAVAMRQPGGPEIPHVVVDFRNRDLKGLTEISSLEAPHRVYDAILRDSLLDETPFMESACGRSLALATPQDASALLEISPTALLFGAWHSTGSGGGLGAKFARALVSEIVGVGVSVDASDAVIRAPRENRSTVENQKKAEDQENGLAIDIDRLKTAGRRTGSRIDPLGVLRKVEVWKAENGAWDVAKFNKAKQVRPSEINHGNIAPSVSPLGVTCDYAEHTAVLTFAGLRRLGFGGDPDKDGAGRALIAALGIMGLTEQDSHGYALRSRCDLVCEGRAPYEIVQPDGTPIQVDITRENARALYDDALAAARRAGFALLDEPLRLIPQDKLVSIIRQSQEMALLGQGGEDEEAA